MASVTKERKIQLLTQFNENIELFECVKEALLEGIYENGVTAAGRPHDAKKNWALALVLNNEQSTPNEVIGARLVAIAEGIRFVESSFAKIEETYKAETIPKAKKNEAR